MRDRIEAIQAAAPYLGIDGPKMQALDARDIEQALARAEQHLVALLKAARAAEPVARGYLFGALLELSRQVETHAAEAVGLLNPSYSYGASTTRQRASRLATAATKARDEAREEIGRGALRVLGVAQVAKR